MRAAGRLELSQALDAAVGAVEIYQQLAQQHPKENRVTGSASETGPWEPADQAPRPATGTAALTTLLPSVVTTLPAGPFRNHA